MSECVAGALLYKHKGNKHRQNDRPRCDEKVVFFLLMCCGRRPQAALSQPVHYYCTWPFCALGDLAWEPWPSTHGLPTYAWSVTQGHSPVRDNSCMHYQQTKPKYTLCSTVASREQQTVEILKGTLLNLWCTPFLYMIRTLIWTTPCFLFCFMLVSNST